jgi:GTP-binding protein
VKEYQVLLNELKQHNPELLDKNRILAISKSDLLDEELKDEIRKEIEPQQCIFISAMVQDNIVELKDMLWQKINEAND